MARPSLFSPDIATTICDRLVSGESLRTIVADNAMPGETTVRRWLASEGEEFAAFRRDYAQAREMQADHYADRIVDDAVSATDAQLGRLKMDALKWAASKLAPKKYGDKVALVGGDPAQGDQPIQVSDRDRAKAIAALIAGLKGD